MKAKQNHYDRISQARILRGIIASLVLCIAMLLFAVVMTGQQVEALQEPMAAMTVEVRLLAE